MLVLSRKRQESVVVGNSDRDERMMTITVIEIRGNRVKLGFEADNEVSVQRLELWERRSADESYAQTQQCGGESDGPLGG